MEFRVQMLAEVLPFPGYGYRIHCNPSVRNKVWQMVLNVPVHGHPLQLEVCDILFRFTGGLKTWNQYSVFVIPNMLTTQTDPRVIFEGVYRGALYNPSLVRALIQELVSRR